ncbi:thymopoietin b isoform X1 [Cyprinodon tularosa]|uniref:thymopoietin b isoform X1 n=1 Tax=Cyprinodon tularosa TaxID=77115 RepID=UPI0018E28E43|nr:thymopoietin b isoform X1 [Cyprinodon tularosa]
MAEFLEDPSVLTKDKLKNELSAHNVPLPSGDQKKEVYVQLYLKNLTVLNNKKSPPVDTFSSDEELPTPVVSNRSRSGRKATKKTDKPRTEEVEVTELSDEDLKQQLAKHGVDTGPIVASTRKVYEKKLQKLLGEPAAEAGAPTDVTTLPKADSNQNGNTNSDHYSDKEDVEITEPEAVPVVEKPVRSRGKAPVTVRTSSRRQTKVVEEVVIEETPKKANKGVVEDILANEISTPTGISATCRRPIRGAAGRPLKPSEYWLDESRVQRTVHTESRSYTETYSQPSSTVASSKPPAGRGFLPLLLKLLLLVVVIGSLYFVYQNLSADQVDALKGLLDNVVVPVQSAVESAANYLGIGSSKAAIDGAGN